MVKALPKMNWTGGRLSRHSRKADGSIVSKQKQHFAKVRSNFMNGFVKRSPAKWSIFDKIAVESRAEASVKSATLQTIAQHPSTGLNYDLHNHRTPSRKHRRAADDEQQYEQSRYNDRGNLVKPTLKGYSTVVRPVHTEDFDNGLNNFGDEMETIRRKKLEILRNGDWVGLSIQRPLHLKYAPSGNQDGIGKRRRLHYGHKAQYEKIEDKIVSLFAPNRDVQRGDIFTDHEKNGQLATQDGRVFDTKSNVRIFIDGRERLIGASSSTAPNRPLNGFVQSSSSSDIMLLDLEGDRPGSERSFQIDPRLSNLQHNRQSSRRQSTSSYGVYPSSGPHIHHTQGSNHTMQLPRHQLQHLWGTTAEDTPSHMVNSNLSLPSASSRLSVRQTIQSNNYASQHDAHPAIQNRSVFHDLGGYEVSQKSKRESQSNSQQTDHKSFKTRRLIMPSSPPVIHHPTPRSSATSRLLRSDSTELESSIAATAGIKPAATASEAQDEDMWKSWLVVDNDNEEAAESFAEGEGASPVSISPGISAYRTHDSQDTPERKSVQSGVSISSPGALSDRAPEPCRLKFVLSLPGRSSSDTGSTTDSDEELLRNPNDTILTEKKTEMSNFKKISMTTEQPICESAEEIVGEENPDEAWKSFILTDATKSLPELLVEPQKPVPKEDPDASWKKFVLSSDSDDENPAFDTFWKNGEAAPTPSRVQKHRPSSEISLRVHPAETAFGSEQPSKPSSIIASIGAVYNPSTYPEQSLASDEDISSTSAVDGRSMYPNLQMSRVSPEYEYNRSAQASSELSEVCLVPDHWPGEDPLSRYMPSAPHLKRKIIFTKPVPFSAPRRDFEEGLEGTLREALHLGRRYAREEREGHITKGGMGKGRGKGYLIPLSDAVEDIDDD